MMRALLHFFRRLHRQWQEKEPIFGLPNWLAGLATLDPRRCARPDFVVFRDDGSPYLVRRWILPRNPLLNVYLHQFRASDDDRALHDHPWMNLSILLRGSYMEHMPQLQLAPTPHVRLPDIQRYVKLRRAPSLVARRSISAHRIELVTPTVWTLFLTGPVIRSWGFHCPQGWKHWRDFTRRDDKGRTGAGCAE